VRTNKSGGTGDDDVLHLFLDNVRASA
jgi:hypothetical protein